MALLGLIASIYRKRFDKLETSHSTLLANYVSRDDLDRDLEKLAAARRQMHEENTRKLERIEDGIKNGFERIHNRIDDIPFRAPNARTRSSDRG